MELTPFDEGIPTEWLVQNHLDRLIQKTDAYGTTDRHPGSGRPTSVRMTDDIAVVMQDLICSQVNEVICVLFYVVRGPLS